MCDASGLASEPVVSNADHPYLKHKFSGFSHIYKPFQIELNHYKFYLEMIKVFCPAYFMLPKRPSRYLRSINDVTWTDKPQLFQINSSQAAVSRNASSILYSTQTLANAALCLIVFSFQMVLVRLLVDSMTSSGWPMPVKADSNKAIVSVITCNENKINRRHLTIL